MGGETDGQSDVASSVDRYVGSQIRLRRLEKGLSVEQLANALTVSVGSMTDYETGRCRLRSQQLAALSQALATPLSFFFATVPELYPTLAEGAGKP